MISRWFQVKGGYGKRLLKQRDPYVWGPSGGREQMRLDQNMQGWELLTQKESLYWGPMGTALPAVTEWKLIKDFLLIKSTFILSFVHASHSVLILNLWTRSERWWLCQDYLKNNELEMSLKLVPLSPSPITIFCIFISSIMATIYLASTMGQIPPGTLQTWCYLCW